ncbi:testis-specific serine/threonine-protein kinase 3-like isoform X1 [Prorops nasuta]|uniref:testis-specific serine/threonine-protein kinase 3-like isoform X1 n=1 Tax=Prorops nasuta TaxID=863751 RepID=UPI0034CE2DF7
MRFGLKQAYRQVVDGRTEKIACKIIDKGRASGDFVSKFLPRELAIVRGLRHPNIVGILDVLCTKRYVYMFMDLYEGGDLLGYILGNGSLPEHTKCRHYFRQIASAVEHLHSLDNAHRDLKRENVLFTDKHCVKIAGPILLDCTCRT